MKLGKNISFSFHKGIDLTYPYVKIIGNRMMGISSGGVEIRWYIRFYIKNYYKKNS
jgi:hypothetical protein